MTQTCDILNSCRWIPAFMPAELGAKQLCMSEVSFTVIVGDICCVISEPNYVCTSIACEVLGQPLNYLLKA